MMDVSIIIVNWNVKKLLHQCLQSIFMLTKNLSFEVIVVDNNSRDGSQEMLQELSYRHNNLHVIYNKDNVGFAKANNQALKVAKGKYILFMNPDMAMIENTPAILVKFMANYPAIAACTCQLQYSDGSRQPNIKRDPTLPSQVWILYKLHHLWQPKFFQRYLAKDFDYTRAQEVEQVMGALIFIKSDVIKKIGGWSQDYFIWWEDVDLCKRLRNIEEKIMYTPASKVIHYESKSFSQQSSLAKQKIFNKSLLMYFKKYHNRLSVIILTLVNLDSLFLAWVVQIFKFKPKNQSRL